ncbi:50S ribosomal protein L27 [Candidatus Saccharibacteria bacterium]|nr:50S ribosomal protein L27 [Candidatus Saccharibacteria bacterium]MBH2007765.1 50S ribosomal protein L27 [Candidatus Saccharibacteria bacterium]
MSKVKAGGSSKNNRKSPGKRLGVKLFGGQAVKEGQVIVRQTGANKIAGDGTYISKNFTIHAGKDGVVEYKKVKKGLFTGKTAPRTQVLVK